MKKRNLFAAFMFASMSAFAQVDMSETVFKNNDVEIHQIDSHTWHGFGNKCYNESIYLIEGDTAALLIDAGMNIPGLRKIAEDIVGKHVILAATHVHSDHTGSAVSEWNEIWINLADTVNIPRDYQLNVKLLGIANHQKFELGGRTIEAVYTPGHTPGSVTYLDYANGYGFSGDAFGSTNLLVFDKLENEVESCRIVERLFKTGAIKHLYPGHNSGSNLETAQRVSDVGSICRDVLSGKQKPMGKGGNGLKHLVKRNEVTVNY